MSTGTPGSVLTVSGSADGGVCATSTVIVTVLVLESTVPSFTENVKESSPSKPLLGVYVTVVPPSWYDRPPSNVSSFIVTVRLSPSMSLAPESRLMLIEVSTSVVLSISDVVGASFTDSQLH
jgi:hypothetical protein